MSAVKKMILEARRMGESFWEVEEDMVRNFTDRVIILTSGLTGTEIPGSELVATAVSDEIVRLLEDFGYSELTLEEIILAVRLNYMPGLKNPVGTDFEKAEAGKRMNVAFLYRVLYNYKVYRDFMEREFENKIKGY